MNKPKILFITDHLNFGGVAKNITVLSSQFLEEGYEAEVILLKNNNKSGLNVNCKVIDLSSFSLVITFLKLIYLLATHKFTLAISSKEKINFLTVLASIFSLKRKKVVISVNTSLIEEFKDGSFRSDILYVASILTINLARHIYCVSEGLRKEIRSLCFYPKKIHKIYNPIKQNILTKEISTNESIEIIAVGRLVKEKQFHILIDAMSLLPDSFKLTIVGEGLLYKNLLIRIQQNRLVERVKILPPVQNINYILSKSDIFVCSSSHEGFGNILVEALLSGLKIISNDCPYGPREILDNGKYGTLIKDFNHINLAEAIKNTDKATVDVHQLINRGKDFAPINCVKEIEKNYLINSNPPI